eukprot:6455655-Amphidinium_carterae.1
MKSGDVCRTVWDTCEVVGVPVLCLRARPEEPLSKDSWGGHGIVACTWLKHTPMCKRVSNQLRIGFPSTFRKCEVTFARPLPACNLPQACKKQGLFTGLPSRAYLPIAFPDNHHNVRLSQRVPLVPKPLRPKEVLECNPFGKDTKVLRGSRAMATLEQIQDSEGTARGTSDLA